MLQYLSATELLKTKLLTARFSYKKGLLKSLVIITKFENHMTDCLDKIKWKLTSNMRRIGRSINLKFP